MPILHPPDRPRLVAHHDIFPFERPFATARGVRTAAHVVTVEITEGSKRGRGEGVPQAHYGETIESVIAQIEEIAPSVETGMIGRRNLSRALPPGAARNAIDCALWDFDAKRGASSAWAMAGLDFPQRMVTAFTISLDTPDAMAAAARGEAHRPLLKLKLGAEDDMERVAAVRAAVPRARLIVDANAAWTVAQLRNYLPRLTAAKVELLEQPLPVEADGALAEISHEIPICADESCRTTEDLDRLAPLYNAINIKLDKAGGFTEALALAQAARDMGFKIVVGCMVASSLGTAPAVLLAQDGDWIDLDGPLLLARDRQPGLRYDGSTLYPPSVSLWG